MRRAAGRPPASIPPMTSHEHSPFLPGRRRLLCCGAAAAAGFFTSLGADPARAATATTVRTAVGTAGLDTRLDAETAALLARCWEGINPAMLWDVHTHLLGNGDSGSGCRLNPVMDQWWHPVELLRKRVIMDAAQARPAEGGSLDRAYVQRLRQLADDFPPGARWLLYAFDEALDAQGRPRSDWTTFHTPDAYAEAMSAARPERFGWVASIHPYRPDALARLARARAGRAVAIKWLPSSMAIDLRDARLRPFYDALAAHRTPLIVHCGEEHAVPGAGREDLGNPLLLREPLRHGVRVIAAHCASLGRALDLDRPRPRREPAFALFARLMDEADGRERLLGDVSAVFQFNREPEVWHTLLQREDWHERLLHGSDYPLPAVRPLHRLGRLVDAEVLSPRDVAPLEALRAQNPLLFDFALKRRVRWQGRGFSPRVFASARHFEGRVA